MKRNLITKIAACFIIAATITNCRNDDSNLINNKQISEQNITNQITSRGEGTMAQQEEYRDLYFSYYKNNLDTLNKNVDYKNVRVDFRFASQVIENEDGTKTILYPFVAYNNVEDVVVAKISEDAEIIQFYFPEHDEFIENAISQFNESLSNKGGETTYGTYIIDEVIINPPKQNPSPPKPRTLLIDAFDFHLPPIDLPSGGGGGNPPVAPTVAPPLIPITDIAQFLNCLNIQQSANLTIFAQKSGNGNGVGHAFISIKQGNNTMTYGFYPKYSGSQQVLGQGIFGDNSGTYYNAAWNTNITPLQLQQLISLTLYYQNTNYDLIFNNCSDFAVDALITIGLNTSTFGFDTPDTVFNMISPGAQSTNGNAATTNRTCP